MEIGSFLSEQRLLRSLRAGPREAALAPGVRWEQPCAENSLGINQTSSSMEPTPHLPRHAQDTHCPQLLPSQATSCVRERRPTHQLDTGHPKPRSQLGGEMDVFTNKCLFALCLFAFWGVVS